MNGADRIGATLRELGVEVVFGLPGTQNIVLYDGLRRSGLRTVTASDEGAAAFMAAGYARASGRVGVLTTIPGPGFLFALPGIAESRDDSAPVLWITLRQADDGMAFPLQSIDQAALAAPVTKGRLFVDDPEQLAAVLAEAHRLAGSDEPGPVLLEVAAPLLTSSAPTAGPQALDSPSAAIPAAAIERIRAAMRPLIIAGQGAQGAAADVRALATRWNAPVLSTSSGRGVVPDAHPSAVVADWSFGVPDVVEDLIDRADLILVLGCKFTHNGSAGGRLRLPQDKLMRVDASAEVLAANYPATVAIRARCEDVVARFASEAGPSAWSEAEVSALRARCAKQRSEPIDHEPRLAGASSVGVSQLFGAMATAFGPNVVYTTDAGLHQALTRRYANVSTARGLLCPSDFQSMGFGLPGAIGAALARPGETVVACVGDGALALSMGDLLTAVREAVDLVVVVFNDGGYGLIRRQQLLTLGHAVATDLPEVDYPALADATGCSYFSASDGLEETLRAMALAKGVRLLEVPLVEASSMARMALKRAVREKVVRAAPDGALRWIKGVLRR